MDLQKIFEQVLNEVKLDKKYTIGYRSDIYNDDFDGCLDCDGRITKSDKHLMSFDSIEDAFDWAKKISRKSSDYTMDTLGIVDESSGNNGKDCKFYSLWDLEHKYKSKITPKKQSFFKSLGI